MGNRDIGIDLGTATVIVYIVGKGVVLCEPSIVVVEALSGKIVSVGEEAFKLLGRTPDNIRAVRPLQDGVISDYVLTEQMIKHFLKKACGNMIFKPRVAFCVPSGITDVESRAVIEAAITAGARKVYLIEEPVAAAIGAGVDISRPSGSMILDIGGGTTDIAVISLNGIVCKTSLKIAGNKFDAALIKYIRNKYSVLIGEKTAESLKQQIGCVWEPKEDDLMEIKGRNLITGLPQKITVSAAETKEALDEPISLIVQAIQSVVERTPPELVADISESGVVLTGGGALLRGLSEYITAELRMKARVADDPTNCVAIGTGRAFEFISILQDGFFNPSTYKYQ